MRLMVELPGVALRDARYQVIGVELRAPSEGRAVAKVADAYEVGDRTVLEIETGNGLGAACCARRSCGCTAGVAAGSRSSHMEESSAAGSAAPR